MSTLLIEIAETCEAWNHGQVTESWRDQWGEHVRGVLQPRLRKYSGMDTRVLIEASDLRRLVFVMSFVHVDAEDEPTQTTTHTITIAPRFVGFEVKVSGRNVKGHKHHIVGTITQALEEPA